MRARCVARELVGAGRDHESAGLPDVRHDRGHRRRRVAGLVTEFTGGTIYPSAVTKPAVLCGDVLTAYQAAGGQALFGFPLADQAAVTGGQVAALQYATVYSSAGAGAHVVRARGRHA